MLTNFLIILGQLYSYSLSNPKTRVHSTKESSSHEDDSYLGYSSASGNLHGDGTSGVAVGMPRSYDLRGKVLIFTWNLTNTKNVTGEQIGEYFGYSLCIGDVDGDGFEDLIIGSPMYTESNNEGKYDTGRVSIYYQGKSAEEKFMWFDTLEGKTSKGRFGLSVAFLGDINLDGLGDFAVGAPYDGPNGRGAVYIFHGRSTSYSSNKAATQIIYAEDVSGFQQLSTFGFSLAGGIDLDGNQYPDMVVGAYNSNRAIVFK
jgi:integrin alpha 8